MREFENSINIIAPTSIVAYAESKSYAQDLVLKEKPAANFKTQEDLLHYITHKVNNVKNKDGRIYLKIDNEGKLYANSISPYASTYLDNIELKIKPLVEALHNKRYLTYSSCEGHGLSFRRYVGLAFADNDSREYVASKIMSLKLPGVFVKRFDSVSNLLVETDAKGYPLFKDKISKDEDSENYKNVKNEETLTFNIQFHRKYESYVFLELVILEEIPFNTVGAKWWFKKIWLSFLKKYCWDFLTNKIVNMVNKEDFYKYKY